MLKIVFLNKIYLQGSIGKMCIIYKLNLNIPSIQMVILLDLLMHFSLDFGRKSCFNPTCSLHNSILRCQKEPAIIHFLQEFRKHGEQKPKSRSTSRNLVPK